MPSPPRIGLNCDVFDGGNIVGLRPAYIEAVRRLGAVPVMVPCGAATSEIDALLDGLDAFILTGGDDLGAERLGRPIPANAVPVDPRRDATDFILIEKLLYRSIPVLAICLGIQELNVLRGGTLWLDIPSELPDSPVVHGTGDVKDGRIASHPVRLAPGTKLRALFGADEIAVNSGHHQAVRAPGAGLVASATAADGVVEAIEVERHQWFVGVQWHPERMGKDPLQAKLFAALLEKA